MTDLPMQPVLEDDVVRLRPMTADDFDALFAIAQDKEIWAIHPAHDRWQEPVFRRFFEEGLASRGSLVIIDKATNAMIGHSRYDNARADPGETEIGWTFLARSHWGGIYNRSIKRLMLCYAFAVGYKAVIFMVGEGNVRSRRAMEKIGGVLSEKTAVATPAGIPITHVVYRIDFVDFEAGALFQDR